VNVVKRLRTLMATATAVATGVVHIVMHGNEQQVELKPGDVAPDFELVGSDRKTYRLKSLAGKPVVLAWFPKAFTGG
jgi:thioredoxin-dependent peroxiredoxin